MVNTDDWPKDVHPLTYDDLQHLGIDTKGRLYWKGELVRTAIRLTFWQNVVAALTLISVVVGAAATVAQAVIAYCQYLK